MEHINKVELLGVVGVVNKFATSENDFYQFSMCTNNMYTESNTSFIETTWHYIKVLKKNIDKTISKGDTVHVFGRLKINSYIIPSGETLRNYIIIAEKVEVL